MSWLPTPRRHYGFYLLQLRRSKLILFCHVNLKWICNQLTSIFSLKPFAIVSASRSSSYLFVEQATNFIVVHLRHEQIRKQKSTNNRLSSVGASPSRWNLIQLKCGMFRFKSFEEFRFVIHPSEAGWRLSRHFSQVCEAFVKAQNKNFYWAEAFSWLSWSGFLDSGEKLNLICDGCWIYQIVSMK